MPRIFQYQALAEPLVIAPPVAPVTFTQPAGPDLVARAAALPAALLAGSLFFVASVAAAPPVPAQAAVVAPDLLRLPAARPHLSPASVLVSGAPFPEATSADRWRPSYPDFLRLPSGRPYQEPQTALGRAAPFPEATSADRWKPILRDWLRAPVGQPSLAPASVLGQAGPYPEAVTADRWKPIYRDWLYAPLGRPSLEPASVLGRAGPFPEATSADRWKPTFPDFLRVPLPRPQIEQVPFAPRVVTAPALTLGWASVGPDWPRLPVGRAHLEPPGILGRTAPFAEITSADRWKPVLRDWLRVPAGQPSLLPTSVSAFVTAAPFPVGWASFGPDATRAIIGRAHLEAPVLFRNAAPFPERVTVDRWLPVRPDLLRVPVGRPQMEPSPVGIRLAPAAPVMGTALFPDWLRVVTGRPYLEPQSVLGRTVFRETVSADRFKPTFPDWLRAPRRHPSQEPAAVLGRAAPFPERVSVDKWKGSAPDILRAMQARAHLLPAAAAPGLAGGVVVPWHLFYRVR